MRGISNARHDGVDDKTHIHESINDIKGCENDKHENDQVDVSQTYCANYMVPDSAATASAMYSGVKTTFFTMGYNSRYSFYTTDKRPKTYLAS